MDKKKLECIEPISFDARTWKQGGNSLIITIPASVVKEFKLRKKDLLRFKACIISCDKCRENCVDMPCKCMRGYLERREEYKKAGL